MLAMNWLLFGIVFFAVGGVGVFVLWRVRRPTPADNPANWPETEATIQTVGRAIGSGRGSYPIDVCDFTYIVNEEYQSGRAMLSRSFTTGDRDPKEMRDKKFKVRFDPRKPERFDLSESDVEGFLLEPYDGTFDDGY